MKRRTKIVAVAGSVVTILVIAFILNRHVLVSIRNRGPNPMRQVVVWVSGAEYALGDIEVGGYASTSVTPTGETDVAIYFVDSTGATRWLRGECYIEPDYGGSVHFDLEGGKIVGVDDNIRFRWWLPFR